MSSSLKGGQGQQYARVDSNNETIPIASAARDVSAKGKSVDPLEMDHTEILFAKGQVQEPEYRDKWFGVAFWIHLVVILCAAILFATGTLETAAVVDPPDSFDGGDRVLVRHRSLWQTTTNRFHRTTPPSIRRFLEDYQDYQGYDDDDTDTDEALSAFGVATFGGNILLSLVLAPVLAILCMSVMERHGEALIQASLLLSIGFNVLLGLLLMLAPSGDDDLSNDDDDSSAAVGAIGPFIFAFILAFYAKKVWHRIPFAAMNLKTAIVVVKSNMGMAWMALAHIPLSITWICVWWYVAACTMNSPSMTAQVQTGDMESEVETQISGLGWAVFTFLLLSLFWTSQVMQNVLHTTLAGTVGTWWFSPHEASSCCSVALTDSWMRSMTYSFGSICLGSLIVAILEVIKTYVRSAARQNRNGIMRCIAQCLLVWIERLAEYFNKWAFVYVGLYGYSYMEAGKNVFALFRDRGWTVLISDALVERMLFMMCFLVGIVNAVLVLIVSLLLDHSEPQVAGVSALIALIVGTMLAGRVFSILISCVDAVIVLYAEAPNEFHEVHPALALEMQTAWTMAWPSIFSPTTPIITATPIV